MRYSYYKSTYNHKWLCKLIVYEYLCNLIFPDKEYINNDELKNYLNDLLMIIIVRGTGDPRWEGVDT